MQQQQQQRQQQQQHNPTKHAQQLRVCLDDCRYELREWRSLLVRRPGEPSSRPQH
jgi:hypothetical protein